MNHLLIKLINNIKTGYKNNKSTIITPCGSSTIEFLKLLNEEGYISNYQIISNKKIKVYLKYFNPYPAIQDIEVISKPGNKIYYKYNDLFKNNTLPLINTPYKKISKRKKKPEENKKIKKNLYKDKKIKRKIGWTTWPSIKFYAKIFIKKRLISWANTRYSYKNVLIKNISLYKKRIKMYQTNELYSADSYKKKYVGVSYIRYTKIRKLKRIEKKPIPGIYYKTNKLFYMTNTFNNKFSSLDRGPGTLILSTTMGLVTHQKACELKLGGELICKIN